MTVNGFYKYLCEKNEILFRSLFILLFYSYVLILSNHVMHFEVSQPTLKIILT